MSRGSVVALIAVAFAGLFGVLLVTWKGQGRAPAPGGGDTAQLEDLAASVRALTDQVAALEQRWMAPATTPGAEGERVALEPRTDAAGANDLLDRRVAWLEAEVVRLSKGAVAPRPVPDDLAALKREMKDKNLYGHDAEPEQVRRRMALDRRFLELGPLDPRAKKVFSRHKADLIRTLGDVDGARALVREFGPAMGMETWQMDLELANIETIRYEQAAAREIFARVLADPSVPLAERVSTEFSIAYSFQQEGLRAEARAAYEALIAAYGVNTPAELQSSVGGARTQLENMAGRDEAK